MIKPTEDEEQDPEYNIMADDEINHIDNEDFRIDKAVKITKKEVCCVIDVNIVLTHFYR